MPSAVSEYTIGVQVKDASGNVIGQGIGSSFKVLPESGNLAMSMVGKTSQRVGEQTDLEVVISP
jgi:hypothetical protein